VRDGAANSGQVGSEASAGRPCGGTASSGRASARSGLASYGQAKRGTAAWRHGELVTALDEVRPSGRRRGWLAANPRSAKERWPEAGEESRPEVGLPASGFHGRSLPTPLAGKETNILFFIFYF
jgi:hypothetical protein